MARSTTFVTYFKSDVDTTAAAKLDQQANQATAAYGRITAAAERASVAAGQLKIGGNAGSSAALDAQAAAARRVGDALTAAGTSTQRFQAAATLVGRASATAAVENDALSKSLISVSTGLSVVQGPLGPVAGRIRALSGAVREFSVSSLGLLGAGGAVFAIASVGNQYAQLETKLRPFFASQQATNNALADVANIAQGARSSLEPIADLYVRLTTLQKELGAGTNVAALASTIAKASTLSGGSAENQAEGIRQLTQGLGRGILNGQDLRALEEDSFNLAKTIADGLGVNVGQLKQLGAEGKLTTEVVVAALTREAAVVDGQFAKLPVTLTSAGREFKNATELFVGGLDQSTGLTNGLAEALQAVATNIRPIATAGIALAAAFTVPKAGTALLGYIDSVTAKLAQQNQAANALAEGRATPISIAPQARAAATAQANLDAAREAESAAAENARLAAERQASIDAEIVKIRQRIAAVREGAAADVAAAEQRAAAARSAAAVEAEADLQAATAAAALAREQELAARQALLTASAARAQAEGRVTSATSDVESAAADTTTTRAARNRALETADRSLQIAEAELAVATTAEADAQTVASAAEQARIDARAALNTLLANSATASAEVTAAELAYTEALTAEAAVNAEIAGSLPAIVALRNELTVAALATKTAEEAQVVATIAVADASEVAAVKTTVLKDAMIAVQETGSLLAAGFGNLVDLLGGPLTIAIGLATAALVFYTSKTAELDTVIDGLNAKQKDQIDLIGKTTTAYENLSVAALKAARDQTQGKIISARDALSDAQSTFTQTLQTNLEKLGSSDPRRAQLQTIIANYQKGASAQSTYSAFSDLGLGNQTAGQSTLGKILTFGQIGADASQVATAFTNVQKATAAAGFVVQNFTDATNALGQAGKPLPAILGNAGKSLADIKADAAVAADNGTAAAREAALNRDNLRKLDDKYGKGTVDPETGLAAAGKSLSAEQAAEAQAAYTAEDRRHNAALANIKQETAAAHAAAQAAKADRLGALDDQRLNALIDLEKRRGTLSVADYNAEKEAIDARYDREKAQIDATGARSHEAKQQELADLTALNKKYDEAQSKVDAFAAKYTDQPKPQAQFQAAIDSLEKLRGTTDASGNSIDPKIDAAERDAVSPVAKAIKDYTEEQEHSLQITALQAAGQDAIATALQKAYELTQQQGDISASDLDTLIRQAQEHERINALLSDRKRITDTILGTVDSTRQALTSLLSGQTNAKQFGQTLVQNFKTAQADILTTKLFAGVDPAVKSLFVPQTAADKAQDAFAATIRATGGHLTDFDSGVDKVVSSMDTLNTALLGLTNHVNTAATGAASGVGTGGLAALASTLTEPALNIASAVPDQVDYSDATKAAFGGGQTDNNQIVVTAKLADPSIKTLSNILSTPTPSLTAAYSTIFGKVGANLDTITGKLFGKNVGGSSSASGSSSGLFGKLGSSLGTALQGYSLGSVGGKGAGLIGGLSGLFSKQADGSSLLGNSGIGGDITSLSSSIGQALPVYAAGQAIDNVLAKGVQALGIKYSKTGQEIGGLLGGIIGGLFKKTPLGGAHLATDANGSVQTTEVVGSNSADKATAKTQASAFGTTIASIAQTLGATVASNLQLGSIGVRNKKYYFDPTPGTNAGREEFSTQEEAQQAALVYALNQGVIKGISAASQKIISSGQDLQTALQKALTIENIPKQLEALTNPVKSAVDVLNTQFQQVIADLNEGGATAEQYAQAQQLYDLQRATAIQQAAKSVFGTVEDYITSLTSGSDSPLNKTTTLANARTAFGSLAGQIDAGKSVDQDALVTAAKNLQAASSASNGTNTSFFADFDYILAELKKADATATAGVNTSADQSLPASPFTTDTTAAAAIASLAKSNSSDTQDQTKALVDAITSLGVKLTTGTTSGGSSVAFQLLPGAVKAR